MRTILYLIICATNFCFAQLIKSPRYFNTIQASVSLRAESRIEDNRISPPLNQDFDNSSIYEFKAYQHRYIIGRYLAVGIGATASYQSSPNLFYSQIFVDLRGFLSDENNTVYPFIQMGTGFAYSNAYNRNFNTGIGIGYKFFIGELLIASDIFLDGRVFRLRGDGRDREYNVLGTGGIHISLGVQLFNLED